MKNGNTRLKNDEPIEVEFSSGNVFADLGFPNSAEEFAKARLAARICQVITDLRLSQARAAKKLGLNQTKLSDLVHGRLADFSTEMLFRHLNELGQEVEIVIRPVRKKKRKGGIQVLTTSV